MALKRMYMTGILAVCLTVIRLTTGTCDSETIINKTSGEISINGYDDNQDCQWKFLPGTNWNQLRITLTSYDITTNKNTEECSRDVLRIGDVDICGKTEIDECYIFFNKNSALTEKCISDRCCTRLPTDIWPPKVIFESDEKNIDGGFCLTYEFKICRAFPERRNNKTSIEGRECNTKTSTPPKKKHVKPNIGVTTYMNDLATTTTTSAEGTHTTLVIILVVGFFVLVLFAALLFIIIRKKKKSKKPDSNTTNIETNGTGEGMYATIRDGNIDSENERQSSSGYGMVNNVIYESR